MITTPAESANDLGRELPSQVEDSLKKRYLYKFGSNLFGFGVAAVTQTLVPRSLGPAAYGDYVFLTNFFSGVVNTLDFGSSWGLYSKLSRRLHESALLRFYGRVAMLIGVIVLGFVIGAFGFGFDATLWPNQSARFIVMAAVLGLLMWYGQVINYVVDAYGFTAAGELTRVRQRILGIALVLLLVAFNRLNLTAFFLYNYCTLLFACIGWWRILERNDVGLSRSARLDPVAARGYVREFYEYSAPMFAYSLTGLLVDSFDRWLLQVWGGSIQQGFLGLGAQLGMVCFLFTSALTPLFVREFSRAFGDSDLPQMQALFRRYVPLFYALAAFFAVFVAFQAHTIALIFGDKFRGAAIPIAVMVLYPIHQTYGQLSGSIFLATGRTALLRNVGVTGVLLGVPVTFLLIGPRSWFGLDLGATGLALKMVLMQLVTVNAQLWFNTRLLKLSFSHFLWHQCLVLLVLGTLAALSTFTGEALSPVPVVSFIVSGTIYVAGCLAVAVWIPAVFAVSRLELAQHVDQLRTYLHRFLTSSTN